jgi:hypothetical protein
MKRRRAAKASFDSEMDRETIQLAFEEGGNK